MNTENSQEQTQTPKYKVGDVVWVPILGEIRGDNGKLFEQAKIVALVYSRCDGKSDFKGYVLSANTEFGSVKESAVFATREEVEALIDKIQAEAKAQMEDE